MQYYYSMLSSVEILILSAIQGISEFLPVSSAAHLVLVSKYYAFTNQSVLIDICLHLGSLIAIIVYFRNDLFHLIKNKSFLIKILIGTIPIIPDGYNQTFGEMEFKLKISIDHRFKAFLKIREFFI